MFSTPVVILEIVRVVLPVSLYQIFQCEQEPKERHILLIELSCCYAVEVYLLHLMIVQYRTCLLNDYKLYRDKTFCR